MMKDECMRFFRYIIGSATWSNDERGRALDVIVYFRGILRKLSGRQGKHAKQPDV